MGSGPEAAPINEAPPDCDGVKHGARLPHMACSRGRC